MSINQPYDTWVSRILQIRPTERITRVRNMALLLHGIFERKSVHVSEVATKIISSAKLLSVTRRLSRFLDNPAVRVREWYAPLAQALLLSAVRSVGEIRLLCDGTKVGSGHQLLMISLAYRRRALPIAWTWVPVARGHSSAITQLALLEYVHRLIPHGSRVLLAGDSEFGAIPVLQQLEAWGWFYVLRQKAIHKVRLTEHGEWQALSTLVQHPGQSSWYAEVELTYKYAHPTNVLVYWQVGEAEPWLLATNLPHLRIALQVYGRRMWTEEMFGDLKGHGFDLESTHLRHIARLSRLTLAVVLLYVWAISVGSAVIKNGRRFWVDRADRRDLSIFQIGLRWVDRRLTNSETVPMRLCPV